MDATLKVLLVEDNLPDARYLEEMIRDSSFSGISIKTVGRLAEGFEALGEFKPDVVLLDLSLPDSQGLETFDNLHQASPETPMLVLTGNDDEELGISAIHRGAQDYLVKGQIDSQLIIRAIRYSVERKRNEMQLRKDAIFNTLASLYTTEYISNRLEIELASSKRYGYPLSLALCQPEDVEGDKLVHESISFQIGKILLEELRLENISGRHNGNQFIILFPNTPAKRAAIALKRVQTRLNNEVFKRLDNSFFTLKTDFAVVDSYKKHKGVENLLETLEKAMDVAREVGNIHIVARES